ncbi:MBOAT family O-acyltransferase [Prevotella dentasini]|uniref:MBOAT family O-acyltransferase n=1 Tax=Prevotella dentasini TaxID=589537 RepID=UPI0004684715|nr:MBOAT family O-acyltransferase [Prevotella dentasini]
MIEPSQLLPSLLSFLSTSDGSWSLCTIPFMAAFVAFFALYLVFCKERRSWMQLYVVAFSLFFAFKANGALMVLLPTTALLSWFLTPKMMRLRRGTPRRAGLWLVILIELLPLLYYKYTDFTLSIFNDLLKTNFALQHLFLPIGISFYTFQAISYTVDVYKERFPKTTGLVEYLFYLTFFPLLVAGPITRAGVLIPQISQPRPVSKELVDRGLWLIVCGLLKKGVIADYLAQYNNWIFSDPTAYSGFENVMGVLGYTLQIYSDFSGYSDLAIGIAALMGFELKDNFRFPYQSLNLTEFWHRWHISLSTWFRDYLYIPLGGNRRGNLRTYANSFIAMIVAGLWHGASGMFVVWGLLHGVGLVCHKFLNNHLLKRIPDNLAVRVISWSVTFGYVAFAWIFFRSPDIDTAFALIGNVCDDFTLADFHPFVMARPLWMLLLAVGLELHSIRESDYLWMQQRFVRFPWIVKFIVFAVVVQMVIHLSMDNVQPFVYTQF